MASLRRNKTLSPDGQTAKFLYTIIKQLDLKAIDWNLVAGSLEITNGHAARMRYSRFKQHMEGATTQPRAPRAGKKEKEGKEGKEVGKKGKKRGFEEDMDDQKEAPVFPKSEPGLAGTGVRVKRECIKSEPDPEPSPSAVQVKPEPGLLPDEWVAVSEAPSATRVKQEPEPDDDNNNNHNSTLNPDIWRILPHTPSNKTTPQNQPPPRSTPLPNQLLDPALRPSHPLPTPQPTVSLADLEISPKPHAPDDDITSSADGGPPPPPRNSNFITTGFAPGRQSVLAASAGSGSGSVQIKAEPLSDVEWMITGAGAGADVMVKSEPLEI